MERLTLKRGLCDMASTEFCFEQKDCYTCTHGRKCFNRLAAYEDTGLEPEEIAVLRRIEAGEYIARDEAVALIEEKQKALCPVGRFSRHAVYGTDRETFDAWQEIIDAIENIQSAKVEPFPNTPLTLDELRKMDGDKIFIRYIGECKNLYGYHDRYAPYYGEQELYVELNCDEPTVSYLELKNYGKTWLAYRSKPEEVGKDA